MLKLVHVADIVPYMPSLHHMFADVGSARKQILNIILWFCILKVSRKAADHETNCKS